MNWLVVFEVMKLVPAIIEGMKALENAVPEPGHGTDKLNALHDILSAINENIDKYWPTIEKVVTVLANLFNKTGVFQKAA